MGQSESGYMKEKAGQATLESCRLEGSIARCHGVSSASNPYLAPEHQPSAGGGSEQSWYLRCDAWWRGWDAEDERRRSTSRPSAHTASGPSAAPAH